MAIGSIAGPNVQCPKPPAPASDTCPLPARNEGQPAPPAPPVDECQVPWHDHAHDPDKAGDGPGHLIGGLAANFAAH